MKILTFSAYYTPEIAASMYLTEDMLQSLSEAGHDVTLYVPTPTRGIDNKTRKLYKKRKKESLYGGHLTIRRFALYRENRNTLARAFRYGLLNLAFFFKGLFKKTDLIYAQSTPPTQGLVGGLLGKIKRKPFVYNLQDIFPDSLVHTGMTKKGSLLWKIGAKIEQITYKNADKIVVISEDFKKNIMEKGVPEEKIVVIRNWVDENAVVNVERKDNSLFDEYGLDRSKFYICYSGNIGFTQNMNMLLDTAKALSEHNEIGFILVGDGAAKAHVEERVKSENIGNVTMIPFQPYEKISEVFSLGDCGLIISKAGVGNNSVPSKTWSIMSAERPVLASFDKGYELDRVITEAECGICVQADDKDALKEAILNMYENRDNLKVQGANGRKYIMENLTREIGTSKWVEVMKNI